MTADQVPVPETGSLSPKGRLGRLGKLQEQMVGALTGLTLEVERGVRLPAAELAAVTAMAGALQRRLAALQQWQGQLEAPRPAAAERRRAPRRKPPAERLPAATAAEIAHPPVQPEERGAPADDPPCTAAAPEPAAEPVIVAPALDGKRRIDDLCRDYEPAPRPQPGLCVPLPPDFEDDPHFRLSDPLIVGAGGRTPQYGTLGRLRPGRARVGLNLNESFCLSTFSVPGGGKSYLCNVILQMALQPLRYLNVLPRPQCGLVLHTHGSGTYEPEALCAVLPNQNAREVLTLIEDYGTLPKGLTDVVLLVPASQVARMRGRYPHLRVFPILFAPGELGSEGWKVLLGLNDESHDLLYARLLRQALAELREDLSLGALEGLLAGRDLPEPVRRLIETRLGFVRPYLADGYPLRRLLRPGRLIIVDVRDEWVPRKEVLGLFALLTSILTRRDPAQDFNLMVCLDEAHKLMEDRSLRAEIERLVRERRHLQLSLLLASQDPLSLPPALVSLSDVLAIGKIQSEEWLKRIVKANGALRYLKTAHTAQLGRGRMMVWSERQHLDGVDAGQLLPANVLDIRPQVAHHGGATRTAVR